MTSMTNRRAAACAMIAGLAVSTASAQVFQREVGDTNQEWAFSIDTTFDGGSVSAGYRRLPGRSFDFHIIKFASDGSTDWEVTFGGEREDIAYSIQQTDDGGYIIAGESRSFEDGFEIVLLRLDAAGNQIWANSYPGSFMVDPVHDRHPGVALDQGLDGEVYVVGRRGNAAGSRPVAFRVDPSGGLDWYARYTVPPVFGDFGQLAFTDVAYSFTDRTIVISGTLRDEGPLFPGSTGPFQTRQDAALLKVTADPDSVAGIPGGLPLWMNRYNSVFDRDSPNEPNVWETGDGLDLFNQDQIILAGRTDLGIDGPGGALRSTHLIHTDRDGMPFWSTDYETLTDAGNAAFVETAYAAVEYDPRFDAVVQAGRVVADGPTNAHSQLTALGGSPLWAWRYGGDEPRAFGESVQPDLEGCGYVYNGRIDQPTPAPGQGSGEVFLFKNNDAGETGCREQQLFPEPVAPLMPEPLQIFPEFEEGQIPLPDLTSFADGPNTIECLSDDCDPAVGPCNPADIAMPYGVLDLADIDAFVLGFGVDPITDIAPVFGVWDLADIDLFIISFFAGCP